MLYYTILYYTILYYTILYYTILYYTILYYTILYYTRLRVVASLAVLAMGCSVAAWEDRTCDCERIGPWVQGLVRRVRV